MLRTGRDAAVLCLLAAALAGCGGGAPQSASPSRPSPVSTTGSPSAEAGSPTPTVPEAPDRSGIVLLRGSELVFVDPATGAIRSSTRLDGRPAGPDIPEDVPAATALRQSFSRDFSLLADAPGQGRPETQHKLTVQRLDGLGPVEVAAPTPTSFTGGQVYASLPLFSPVDDRLWYVEQTVTRTPEGTSVTRGQLVSIDPQAGVASRRIERADSRLFDTSCCALNSGGGYVFAADGTPVALREGLREAAGGRQPGGPDAVRVRYVAVGDELLGATVTVTVPSPNGSGNAAQNKCRALQALPGGRLLCAAGSQLYLVTVAGTTATARGLLPPSDRSVGAALLGPDGNRVVFLAGGSAYATTLAGGEPTPLPGFPRGGSLVGWT